MMLLEKKMFFSKTYDYFIKDKTAYLPRECHLNTYDKFYKYNYKDVEANPKSFNYVTGLLCFTSKDKKYCVVHSWVEYNGMVLDMTSLANSQLLINKDDNVIDSIRESIAEHYSYISYFTLTNSKFNKKCQELYAQSFNNQNNFLQNLNEWLISIATSVENDVEFLKRVEDKYGYIFKNDDFILNIDERKID